VNRFVLVEADDATFDAVVRRIGAGTVDGFDINVSVDDVVCVGTIDDVRDAERAVLAAVRGAGIVARGRASREILDRLCDDLRRLGPLTHITEPIAPSPLSDEQRSLLQLLGDGKTLGETAKQLHISRRTADRRLQQARDALGVGTTAEAVLALRKTEAL